MNHIIPAKLRGWFALAEVMEALARETIKSSHQAYKERRRQRRGATLRPGPGTPLWNELAHWVEIHLTKHGDKANLGRLLGLSRQRIHQLLVEKSSHPDAERTLLLLIWLQARMSGRTLS